MAPTGSPAWRPVATTSSSSHARVRRGTRSSGTDSTARRPSRRRCGSGQASQTSGIDARLSIGGTISGHAFGTSGKPLRNICVFAFDPVTSYAGIGTTARNGAYTIPALPSGHLHGRVLPVRQPEPDPGALQRKGDGTARGDRPECHAAAWRVDLRDCHGGGLGLAGRERLRRGSQQRPEQPWRLRCYQSGRHLPGDRPGRPARTRSTSPTRRACSAQPRLSRSGTTTSQRRRPPIPVSVTVGHTTPSIDAALQPRRCDSRADHRHCVQSRQRAAGRHLRHCRAVLGRPGRLAAGRGRQPDGRLPADRIDAWPVQGRVLGRLRRQRVPAAVVAGR